MNQAHSSYAINDEKKPNSYHEARNGGKNNRESFLFWGWGGGGGQSSCVAKIFLVRWDIISVVM